MIPQDEKAVTSDREIVLTREVDAPRELVWKVWTNAEHLASWWGPTGFTIRTSSFDVRPGGRWRFVMIGPDGREYENLITYSEVSEPARLVYKHGGEVDLEPVQFSVTIDFEELPGSKPRTRVTMRSIFPSAKARDHVVREYGAIEGGKQTLARLAELVAGLANQGSAAAKPASKPFELRRVVRAPRDLVFRVWTDPAHLEKWFGPQGCTLSVRAFELRPGGRFLYRMEFGGDVHFAKWTFREIQAPEKLVFVLAFTDEQGTEIPAPFFPVWPLRWLSTITFEEHAGIGRGTVVTVRSTPLDATAEEERAFAENHGSMQQGWSGTFDKLEEHLAKL
jgi:uncharacterized protein YndB with AHSA1/START domain